MTIPKVFVSYSHDSLEHKQWVLDLATKLRTNGVDAVIDQWDLKPGDDLPHFMETQLASADRVLMICTDKYVEKANSGVGGVGYERMIITADLLRTIDSNKVIPIIRQAAAVTLPTFLKTKLYINLSRPDQFEFGLDELVRTLHNAPLYVKPPVTSASFPSTAAPPQRSGDGLREFMAAVVRQFEDDTGKHSYYPYLVGSTKISRVMLDLLFAEAEQKGLVRRVDHNWYLLTDKGKLYAIENSLLKRSGAA